MHLTTFSKSGSIPAALVLKNSAALGLAAVIVSPVDHSSGVPGADSAPIPKQVL